MKNDTNNTNTESQNMQALYNANVQLDPIDLIRQRALEWDRETRAQCDACGELKTPNGITEYTTRYDRIRLCQDCTKDSEARFW